MGESDFSELYGNFKRDFKRKAYESIKESIYGIPKLINAGVRGSLEGILKLHTIPGMIGNFGEDQLLSFTEDLDDKYVPIALLSGAVSFIVGAYGYFYLAQEHSKWAWTFAVTNALSLMSTLLDQSNQ